MHLSRLHSSTFHTPSRVPFMAPKSDGAMNGTLQRQSRRLIHRNPTPRLLAVDYDGPLRSIDLAIIPRAEPFTSSRRDLGGFHHAGRAILEVRQNTHPIFYVRGLAAARVDQSLGPSRHPIDRAEEHLAEVDSMRKHVAEFPGRAELFGLPPSQVSVPPILESLHAEMIRPSDES